MKQTECPYPKGTGFRRHWNDGWNWFVAGKARATPPRGFEEGYEAARVFQAKNGKVETREDY